MRTSFRHEEIPAEAIDEISFDPDAFRYSENEKHWVVLQDGNYIVDGKRRELKKGDVIEHGDVVSLEGPPGSAGKTYVQPAGQGREGIRGTVHADLLVDIPELDVHKDGTTRTHHGDDGMQSARGTQESAKENFQDQPPGGAQKQVFFQIDSDGKTHYLDSPPPGGAQKYFPENHVGSSSPQLYTLDERGNKVARTVQSTTLTGTINGSDNTPPPTGTTTQGRKNIGGKEDTPTRTIEPPTHSLPLPKTGKSGNPFSPTPGNSLSAPKTGKPQFPLVEVQVGQPQKLPIVGQGGLNPAGFNDFLPRFECDTCNLADECPKAEPKSVCAFNEIFDEFDLRDSNAVLAAMQLIVQYDGQRTMMAMMQERLTTGGQIDPKVTAQLDGFLRRVEGLDQAMQARAPKQQNQAYTSRVTIEQNLPHSPHRDGTAATGPSILTQLFGGPQTTTPTEKTENHVIDTTTVPKEKK